MINNRKITNYEDNVANLSDTPNSDGLTADQLKAIFDGRTNKEVKVAINGIIDDLMSTTDGSSGADNIGVTAISGISGTVIQTVLEFIATQLSNTYTKTQTDGMLLLKEDETDANLLLKTVSFNSVDGKFTFTTKGGTTTIIDTNIEKIPASIAIVELGSSYKLRITNTDGSYTECDVSEMFNEINFTDGATIDFTTQTESDGSKTVSAEVKAGSLDDTYLTSAYKATLQGYCTDAETAKTGAETANTNAQTAKTDAVTAKNDAVAAKNASVQANTDAQSAKTSAETAENTAVEKAEDSEAWAIGKRNGVDVPSTDEAYHNNAKYFKDQAQEIVGGDYATKTYVDNAVDGRVEKVEGKGLSTNDYDDIEKAKVTNAASKYPVASETQITNNTIVSICGDETTTTVITESGNNNVITSTVVSGGETIHQSVTTITPFGEIETEVII